MTEHEKFSDELLNAYVDGELAAEDRRPIEQAMAEDELLRQRVRELQEIKQLVRDAYVDEKPARAPAPPRRNWTMPIAASVAMFALGAALSWGLLSYTGEPGARRTASAPGIEHSGPVQATDEVKVVFHLSRDDPARLNDVLNESEALLAKTSENNRPAAVRVIVSGSGLALFEKGSSPDAQRITELKRSYQDRIVFNGCGVAYQQLKRREGHGEFELLPEVQLVDLGVLELMRRQRTGWTYIHL